MSSFGWYILGYFGLGVLVWFIGAIVISIAAGISDYRWDLKNDPSMSRTDTLDALNSIGDDAVGKLKDICNMEENPREAKVRYSLIALVKWPWTLPQAFTILWNRMVELRDRNR